MNVVSKLFRRTVMVIVGITLYVVPAVLMAWFAFDFLGIEPASNFGFVVFCVMVFGLFPAFIWWLCRKPWFIRFCEWTERD